MLFVILQAAASILTAFNGSVAGISSFMLTYGYVAIFLLLVLEAASIPIPSEITLPAMGYLAAVGDLNLGLALLVAFAGSVVGMAIDYYVAYFFEKDVVYKHVNLFHVTKEQLDRFDAWFSRNGPFAVFVTRLLPVLRGLINFPAGFAKMPVSRFYLFSLPGVIIWEVVLTLFGYYALTANIYVASVAAAVFVAVVYVLYRIARKRMS